MEEREGEQYRNTIYMKISKNIKAMVIYNYSYNLGDYPFRKHLSF